MNVPELAEIAAAPGRKHRLTLVFDQSNVRERDRRERVKDRLERLRRPGEEPYQHEIHGAADVCKHVVYIWVSADKGAVVDATRRLRRLSGLPVSRLIGDGT